MQPTNHIPPTPHKQPTTRVDRNDDRVLEQVRELQHSFEKQMVQCTPVMQTNTLNK